MPKGPLPRDPLPKGPLHRAKTYPYPILDHSFVFREGRAHALADETDLPDLSGRTPVLAVGSNQSPEQLRRKFGDHDGGEIPVIRIELGNFDSVYSPHIAAYGAIAATLQEAPGVTVTLFVTWLTDTQLVRMHETEVSSANYGFALLSGLDIRAETGPPLDSLHIYTSTRGTLVHDGTPVPIAEIPACGRLWRARGQMDVQHLVRDRLAPDVALDTFIHESIGDAALRRDRSDRLRDGAWPFQPAGLRQIPI